MVIKIEPYYRLELNSLYVRRIFAYSVSVVNYQELYPNHCIRSCMLTYSRIKCQI